MDFEKIASLLESMTPVNVRDNLCSRQITPRSSCDKCIKVCPTKGIALRNNKPKIENCISCGLCVFACPNHVFKQEEEILLQIDPQRTHSLIITCSLALSPVPEKHKHHFTVINCLNQLYPELILKLVSRFAKVVIYYDSDKCNDCLPNLVFQPNIIEGYASIFKEDQAKLQFTQELKGILPLFKTESPAHDRRLFFKSIFSGSQKVSKNLINSTLNQLNIDLLDNEEKETPLKRRYLSEALKELKADKSIKLPLKKLQIEKCNFCGVCSKLCPTQALKIINEDNRKQILFYPHLCTHCDVCYDACFFKGLSWAGNLTAEDFISPTKYIIASGEKRFCRECEQEFYDANEESENCFLCSSLK